MSDIDKKIDDNDKMTLELDDGTTLVCDVIGVFSGTNADYIALLPEDAPDDGDIYLYRFTMEDDDFDNIKLDVIEDDAEFEDASKAFDAYMESLELLDEEDE